MRLMKPSRCKWRSVSVSMRCEMSLISRRSTPKRLGPGFEMGEHQHTPLVADAVQHIAHRASGGEIGVEAVGFHFIQHGGSFEVTSGGKSAVLGISILVV